MHTKKKLKDWFDDALVTRLCCDIKEHHTEFNHRSVLITYRSSYLALELKERVKLIADLLAQHLPQNYPKALALLKKTWGPPLPQAKGMYKEYYHLMPHAKFIEDYGIDHFDLSMRALKSLTMRHTGEFAIRPYLICDLKKAFKHIQLWSTDKNLHVRRLASEGIRPRLPWAFKLSALIEKPQLVIPIYDTLKNDDELFVRRSVANGMADIIKDNPDVAYKTLAKWTKLKSPNIKWTVKHAIRLPLKKHDKRAQAIAENLSPVL